MTGRDRSPGSAASRPCPQHLLLSQSGQGPPWHPEAMGCLCCRHKPTDDADLPGPNPQRPIYDDQGNAHARARPPSITAEGTACGAMRARLAGNGSPSSGRQLGRGGRGRCCFVRASLTGNGSPSSGRQLGRGGSGWCVCQSGREQSAAQSAPCPHIVNYSGEALPPSRETSF